MDRFNTPYEDNEMIGYFGEKAIVKTESDKLFYVEIPPMLFQAGETVHPNDLTPITKLSKEDQKRIEKAFED